jgi:hypothetical protein
MRSTMLIFMLTGYQIDEGTPIRGSRLDASWIARTQ